MNLLHIETDDALREFATALQGARLLALDTEAASFHRYNNRIYLLQLSSRDITAVIDPLAVSSVTALQPFLEDPGIEIIFHDADFDLRLLDRDYGLRVRNIFDTRIAAQLLNEPGIGLAALLEKYLGARVDKRFQRADWSRRPLSREMLAYAATDTHHLPALRDLLRQRLVERGRLAWAEEEFLRLEEIRWSPPDEEGFWRIKGSRHLKGTTLAVLREVYEWREEVARELDRAPFRVMNNDVLLVLAQACPTDLASLKATKGVGTEVVERRGMEVLAAIRRGLATQPDEVPRLERARKKPPDPAYFDRLERLKEARNAAAARVDLPPGVLCPNHALEAVARGAPKTREGLRTIPELARWQEGVVGDELLRALNAKS